MLLAGSMMSVTASLPVLRGGEYPGKGGSEMLKHLTNGALASREYELLRESI